MFRWNYDRTQRLSSEGANHTLQKMFDISFSLESAVEQSAIIQEELKNTIKSVAKIDKNMHTAAGNTKCFRCEDNYKAKSCPFLNKECYFCKFKEHIKNMPKKAEIDAIYLILHPKHPVRELLKAGLYDEIFLSRPWNFSFYFERKVSKYFRKWNVCREILFSLFTQSSFIHTIMITFHS